jgi:hypothetical protein
MTYIAQNPKLNKRWLNELEDAVKENAIPDEDPDEDGLAWRDALSIMDIFPNPDENLEVIVFARLSL